MPYNKETYTRVINIKAIIKFFTLGLLPIKLEVGEDQEKEHRLYYKLLRRRDADDIGIDKDNDGVSLWFLEKK